MARHTPAHHFRRGNIFYFRLAVPADLKEHFPTRELCFSLGTEKNQIARHKAIGLSVIMLSLFSQLREACMTKEKSSALVEMARQASERLRLREYYEERENALTSQLAAAYAMRKADAAQHASIIAALTTQHAQTTAALTTAIGTAPATPSPHVIPEGHSAHPALNAQSKSMSISELAEYVLQEKISMGEWTRKTADEYLSSINLLIEIIGNKAARSVTSKDALQFIETIQKLPPNISKSKKLSGMSIIEVANSRNDRTLSPESIKKRIERVSTFFEIATEQSHLDATGVRVNVFKGRAGKIAKKIGVRRKGQTSREVFSEQDIKNLLFGKETAKKEYNNPYHYWLIPIGLLTGARLNEICQLHIEDFKLINGVWCVDINGDGDDKRVKTENSSRTFPLHEKLIELGLLDYVEALRRAGHKRLFPELKQLRDGYGQAASKWFNRHRIACGVSAPEKVFHSLRHTFTTRLIYDEVPDALVSLVVGHNVGEKTMTKTTYLSRNEQRKLKETTVDKLTHFNTILEKYPKVHEVILKVNRKDNFWRMGEMSNIDPLS